MMSKSAGTNPPLYPQYVIRTGGYNVTCLSFPNAVDSEDGKSSSILITGTECGRILVWSLTSQTAIQTLAYEGDNSSLLSIHYLASTTSSPGVLTYNRSQCIRCHTWDKSNNSLSSAVCELKLSTLCPSFCRVDYLWRDSNGSYLISAPNDKTVQFYQLSGLRDSQKTTVLESIQTKLDTECLGMVTCMKLYNSDTNTGAVSILIGSEGGSVYLYTSTTGADNFRLINSLNTHSTNPVVYLDYHTDHHIGCSVGAGSGIISLWKIEDNSSIKHYLNISTPSKGFNQVSLRSDCKLILTCGWDGVLRLHAPKKGTMLALMDFHRDSVHCSVFNNDFSFITSSKDGTLCMWNLYAKNKT